MESIDRSSYKQWSSSGAHAIQVHGEQEDQRTPSDSDCGPSTNQTAQTSAEAEESPLTFAEVMLLVQQGKEVPGVTKVDVKPTNQSPTASQMERILKPWERQSVSK